MTVASLPNIGPQTERLLAAVGIGSEAELREVGAVPAYVRLKFRYPERVSLNALWALQGALTGRPWTALPEDEKAWLRRAVTEVTGR